MAYVEVRSRRALAIDRAKNAKVHYKKFNSEYSQAPNRSDVDGYDTRKRGVSIPRNTPSTKPAAPEKHFELTPMDRAKAVAVFISLPMEQQRKDLRTNEKIVKSEHDFSEWKRQPSRWDVQGIDTVPVGLYQGRLSILQKAAGNVPIKYSKRKTRRGGSYVYYRSNDAIGHINVNLNSETALVFREKYDLPDEFIVGHELGHAFDRNTVASLVKRETPFKRTGNARYLFSDNNGFNEGGFDLSSSREFMKELRAVSTDFHPIDENADYRYLMYRNSSEEVFADFFGGLIVNPDRVAAKAPKAFAKVKSEFNPLFRKFDASDNKVFDAHLNHLKLKLPKIKKGGLF